MGEDNQKQMSYLLLYRLVVESYYERLRVLGMDQRAAGECIVTSNKSISAFTLLDVPETPDHISRLMEKYVVESGLSDAANGSYLANSVDFKLILLDVSTQADEPGRLRVYTPNSTRSPVHERQTDAHYWSTEAAADYALRSSPRPPHWRSGEKVQDPEVLLRVVPLPFMYGAGPNVEPINLVPLELLSFFGTAFLIIDEDGDDVDFRQNYSPVFEAFRTSDGEGMRWSWKESMNGWEGSTFIVETSDFQPREPRGREIQGRLF